MREQHPPPPQRAADPIRWMVVKNTTIEPMPPGALCLVTGVADGVIQVARPNAASLRGLMVNGPWAVPADRLGLATFDDPVMARYDGADGVPAVGEEWGSVNGEWHLKKDNTGYRVIGGEGRELVLVRSEVLATGGPAFPPIVAGNSVEILTALGAINPADCSYDETTGTLTAYVELWGIQYPIFFVLTP